MEIKLDETELLTILQGLEALYDDSKELKNIIYCDEQEYLIDVKEMRKLHNKLLIQAQNEGYLEKDVSLI
ncbi:hypothetical protein [Clostridium beijerinckii]|uniref:Phage protein n=1 Tax=Clostridium beijerinckii TaxID=1520 RepID=A0AAX0B461_CLOBE|nr:hypothetical protein [Clostridium beijerinckii]NRT90004.1 hypothetical protein [Clostridium beijerinckii]NYC69536.1 hypothetical protein [Clostridium beijerinckii]NYC75461.1 hypothetical protein [Clostridium beijerinckii]